MPPCCRAEAALVQWDQAASLEGLPITCAPPAREGSTTRAVRDQNWSLAPPDDDDHDCGWKAYAKAQDRKLAEVMARLEELERRAKGHKSEKRKRSKLPAPVPAPAIEPEETAAKRAALAELRDAKLDVELTQVRVSDASTPSWSS